MYYRNIKKKNIYIYIYVNIFLAFQAKFVKLDDIEKYCILLLKFILNFNIPKFILVKTIIKCLQKKVSINIS